jgi:hypothetical protein|tara:strand:+ start:2364 stop:4175 length:1812 start_codon:yes stop_codon:yes gene_type:complete
MAVNLTAKVGQRILDYLSSLPKDSVVNIAEVKRKFNVAHDTVKSRLDKVNKEKGLNLTSGGSGGSKIESSILTDKEKNIFQKGYNKKNIAQMATEITGLPYDNKITKAKHAQLFRYNLTQSKLGKIDLKKSVKGVRPKGTTPEDLKGFGAYRKAQEDLMNLDPDLYKNLTPAQVDARLKKAINFSKVSGSMDRKAIPLSLHPSFEHFQGIVPGTIAKDPKALSKVGITTKDFNFNVLGARAKNNIYKTIKNNLRTANAALKAGEVDEAKKSIKVVNEIYDDVASKLKTVDRKKLPKYNLKDNFIDEINLKEVKIGSKQNLDKSLTDYIKFVASGPAKDVKKITQPNLKKAVELSLKGDDEGLKKLVKSRVPGVKMGEKFAVTATVGAGAAGAANIDKLDPFTSLEAAEVPIKYNDEAGAFLDPKNDEKVSNRTMLEWAADNPMPTAAVASAPLLNKTVRQSTGKLLKGLLQTIGTPTGVTALTAGLGGVDLTETSDRLGLEAEAAFAKPLVSGSQDVARKFSNSTVRRGLQQILNLGMTPTFAAKAARVASPIGIASLAGEGLYKYGKFAANEIERINDMKENDPDAYAEYLAEQEEQMGVSA